MNAEDIAKIIVVLVIILGIAMSMRPGKSFAPKKQKTETKKKDRSSVRASAERHYDFREK